MARTSTAKNTASNRTAADVSDVKVTEVIEEKVSTMKPKPIASEVDPNQLIAVKNGFQGRLIYVSSRTGERFVFDEFGDVQEIELRELRNAKNSQKSFFTNNWFMFDEDDAWVVSYLGVSQYYANVIDIDSFDDIFEMPPEEVENIVSKVSDGQKKSIEYRARQLLLEDGIDSNKVIAALEKSLGVELVER